jgi:hypothetical protein
MSHALENASNRKGTTCRLHTEHTCIPDKLLSPPYQLTMFTKTMTSDAHGLHSVPTQHLQNSQAATKQAIPTQRTFHVLHHTSPADNNRASENNSSRSTTSKTHHKHHNLPPLGPAIRNPQAISAQTPALRTNGSLTRPPRVLPRPLSRVLPCGKIYVSSAFRTLGVRTVLVGGRVSKDTIRTAGMAALWLGDEARSSR